MPKVITFEEALKRAKAARDESIEQAKAKANQKLAEEIKKEMEAHGKGVSAASRGLGWSRYSTYELCEKAGVEIKRPKNNREETG